MKNVRRPSDLPECGNLDKVQQEIRQRSPPKQPTGRTMNLNLQEHLRERATDQAGPQGAAGTVPLVGRTGEGDKRGDGEGDGGRVTGVMGGNGGGRVTAGGEGVGGRGVTGMVTGGG